MRKLPHLRSQFVARFIRILLFSMIVGLAYGHQMLVHGSGWAVAVSFVMSLSTIYAVGTHKAYLWSLSSSRWYWTRLVFSAASSLLVGMGFVLAYLIVLRMYSRSVCDDILFQCQPAARFGKEYPRFATLGFACLLMIMMFTFGVCRCLFIAIKEHKEHRGRGA